MTDAISKQSLDTLRLNEAAEYLHVPASTLRYWRQQNRGPKSFALGGRVRYQKADLDAWVAGQYALAVGDETPKAS
jgi:excisionase family DNA binding protein